MLHGCPTLVPLEHLRSGKWDTIGAVGRIAGWRQLFFIFTLRGRIVRIGRSQVSQRYNQDQYENGEKPELDHRVSEKLLAVFHYFRQLGGENENAAGYRDQADDQKRRGLQDALAKRDLYRIEDFGKNNDQQDAVEQHYDVFRHLAADEKTAEEADLADQQCEGKPGKKKTKTDVNRVFDELKEIRQPVAQRSFGSDETSSGGALGALYRAQHQRNLHATSRRLNGSVAYRCCRIALCRTCVLLVL